MHVLSMGAMGWAGALEKEISAIGGEVSVELKEGSSAGKSRAGHNLVSLDGIFLFSYYNNREAHTKAIVLNGKKTKTLSFQKKESQNLQSMLAKYNV